MKKRLLLASCLGLLVTGIVLVSIPFISSMGFSQRALANRPQIRIADVAVGDYRLVPPESQSYRGGFLVYREGPETVRVWRLPFVKGQVLLPDLKWERWGMLCSDFALDRLANAFRCMDAELQQYDWVREEMRWTVTGDNLGKYTEDLVVASGEQNGDYFISNEPFTLRR